jgi:hypothetical protein
MAVVMDYYEGKTHCMVDDSCVVKTQAEVEQILQNLYNIYLQSEIAKAREAEEK